MIRLNTGQGWSRCLHSFHVLLCGSTRCRYIWVGNMVSYSTHAGDPRWITSGFYDRGIKNVPPQTNTGGVLIPALDRFLKGIGTSYGYKIYQWEA